MVSPTALLHDGVPLAAPRPVRRERGAARRRRVRLGAVSGRLVSRIAILTLLFGVGVGLGYLRSWPPVATVMSASMSPTIDTGDVVVLRRVTQQPRVGDVIAVSVPEQARSRYGYPPEVIHRVVRVAPDGTITTKGDARDKADPFTVRRSAVNAEVVATIPGGGRVLAFLTSPLGLVWIGSGVLMLILMPMIDRRHETVDAEAAGIGDLRADVDTVLEEVLRLQAAVGAEARARATLEERLAVATAQLASATESLAELPARIEDALVLAREVPAPPAPPAPAAPVRAPVQPPPARRRSGGLIDRLAGRS
ncbi:MAG: signal peptidase [Solirubrobacteraceae bacterium]|jgi:signal peptidase I|nr:signal peptidase [Solirubrobacteraceae bacterium]